MIARAAGVVAALAAVVLLGGCTSGTIFNIPLSSRDLPAAGEPVGTVTDPDPESTPPAEPTPTPTKKAAPTTKPKSSKSSSTPKPKPMAQPKPDLKCLAPTKGELERAQQLVTIYYGGTVDKSAKVVINKEFFVIATHIAGAIDGGVQGLPVNSEHPADITATWIYHKQGGTVTSLEVIDNWTTADGGKLKYGPQVRDRALACLS